MKNTSYDEYEEVESPFAARSANKSSPRDRLRTRKNVFNRPFATASSVAPLILEATSTRRSVGHADMAEMIGHHESELAETDIDYLNDEDSENEVENQVVVHSGSSAKKKTKPKKNLLAKAGWSMIGLLVLRLICMDRGVWDYVATEETIKEKQEELRAIKEENKSLKVEITRIQLDKNYQRHLAKEHLGVIAADEFLILFAGESSDTAVEVASRSL